MAREAYYHAIRDLGIARDTLQVQIGVYHASVLEARNLLIRRAPQMLERFNKAAELFGDHLMDDVVGDEPAQGD